MSNSEWVPYSEFETHLNDQDWYDEGDEIYEDMVEQLREDFGTDKINQEAIDLLYEGWFDPDSTTYERTLARFDFFDLTGLDWDDFDWDAWREWYES